MVINVCITVVYGNYLCLNNHYVYLLIPSLFCLKKRKELYSFIINILQLSTLVLLICHFSQIINHLIEIIGA